MIEAKLLAHFEAGSELLAIYYSRRETKAQCSARATGYLLGGDIKGRVWSGIVAVSFHGYILAYIYLVVPRRKGTNPSKFAETTVPFDVVPARGKALADTKAATESMDTRVEVTCILED